MRDGAVVASIGFRAGEPPDATWARQRASRAPLDDAGTAWLALSRDGEPFNVEETALLRGMARALAQTVRTLELVGSLRSRQALLERLAQIQRSIVRRTDLESLLDAIVDGARELIGDEVVSLRLLDEDDPTLIRLVASVGHRRRRRASAPASAGSPRAARPRRHRRAARDRGRRQRSTDPMLAAEGICAR